MLCFICLKHDYIIFPHELVKCFRWHCKGNKWHFLMKKKTFCPSIHLHPFQVCYFLSFYILLSELTRPWRNCRKCVLTGNRQYVLYLWTRNWTTGVFFHTFFTFPVCFCVYQLGYTTQQVGWTFWDSKEKSSYTTIQFLSFPFSRLDMLNLQNQTKGFHLMKKFMAIWKIIFKP